MGTKVVKGDKGYVILYLFYYCFSVFFTASCCSYNPRKRKKTKNPVPHSSNSRAGMQVKNTGERKGPCTAHNNVAATVCAQTPSKRLWTRAATAPTPIRRDGACML